MGVQGIELRYMSISAHIKKVLSQLIAGGHNFSPSVGVGWGGGGVNMV